MIAQGRDTLTAITVPAELGDITCFDTPCQFMVYVSLVPGERERSSGQRRRMGASIKAGKRAFAGCIGGVVLVLSLPGVQDQAPAAPC